MFSLPDLQLPQQTIIYSGVFLTVFFIILTAIITNLLHREENFKQALLHKISIPLSLLIFISVLIICLWLSYVSEKNRKVPVLSATTENTNLDLKKSENQTWKRLTDNTSSWDLSEVNKKSEGVYCPKGNPNSYNFRTVWLRDPIPLAFKKLEMRFMVQLMEEPKTTLRSVIELGNVYSKNYKVSRFYLPFDGSESVNFEKYYIEKNGLDFQPNPGELQLPIQQNSVVKVSIETVRISENTLSYDYKVEYIPRDEESSVIKTFHYSVTVPDPSPKELLVDFGLGIFYGGCLSDIEYYFE